MAPIIEEVIRFDGLPFFLQVLKPVIDNRVDLKIHTDGNRNKLIFITKKSCNQQKSQLQLKKSAQNRTRTCTTVMATSPSSWRVYQFHHLGSRQNKNEIYQKNDTHLVLFQSEKRDSNPRPRPWQGRALPTELFSHFWYLFLSISFAIQLGFLNPEQRMQRYNFFVSTK